MTDELDTGLAATKLHPPTLPGQLVRRARLDERLDDALAGGLRVVLASAPAGSGKSTLLASWLGARTEAVAWLQVEGSDSDPVRFWTYLVEAIGQALPDLAASVRPVVVGSSGDHDVVVPALVNALTADGAPLIIVIDDYHLIQSPRIHEGMERLIELCPAGTTIIVSTRIDPPFRLGRLRVSGLLAEIRSDDLRFDPDETGGLLGARGRTLDNALIEQLWRRTEGWAAGLVLAELSLRRSVDAAQFVGAFHGDDQLVVDYLTTEFLAGVGSDDRRRLLETSILERFNGSLVDAVTDGDGGRQWLLDTAAGNQLLIGLDRTGSWFRYHHLLRDVLQLEAQDAFADRLPELHARAARWFETHRDVGLAIDHWLAAGERERAAGLMLDYGRQLISAAQIATLRHALERLGEVAATNPWCSLLWAWCEYFAGRYGEAERWVDITHSVLPANFDETVSAPLRMNLSLSRGNVDPALAIARSLSAEERFAEFTAEMATVAGTAYLWAGQTAAARTTLAIGIRQSADEEANATHLLGRIHQALVEFDAGDLAAAAAATNVALETAERFGMLSYHRIGPAFALRARTGSDPTQARADAMRAVDASRRSGGDLALAYVLTICADTLFDIGDPLAASLLAEARTVVDRCPDPGIAARYLERVESRHGAAAPSTEPITAIVEQLTEREIAVLRHLPTKLSQREIASELYVSLNTVKTHCSAIYRKLGVGSRRAAVQAARDLHIL